MKKDIKDNMAHYLKIFTREIVIAVFVVVIFFLAIMGVFCGKLLTQKERIRAELNIAKVEESLKSATAARDKLKQEYSILIEKASKPLLEMPANSLSSTRSTSQNPKMQDRERNPKFYDPDRTPPYMANDQSSHYTRESAIKALADQFDQTPSWVEKHMGTTNDLQQIHYNLNMALLTSQ
jgi:hypothetical protein